VLGRSGKIFFTIWLGLVDLLPFPIFVRYPLVVLTEVATDGLHQIGQLALVTSRIGYDVGHHAACFLPSLVKVQKLRAAYMCAKWGKSIGTRGSRMSFDACEMRSLMHSVPLPRYGIAGTVCFVMSYFIDIQLF
jgi:hypothetical protein